jgi:hypothetical protein
MDAGSVNDARWILNSEPMGITIGDADRAVEILIDWYARG